MSDEKAIFTEAVAISDLAERERFLDRACAGNAELRAQVQALLDAHAQAGSFLELPPADVNTAQSHLPVDLAGTTLGQYKLLERIGEGGMGVVYLAEQIRPVKRRVALKIIKPGLDTKQVIARFEAERQALAMMDHPSIAKVFDAGTTPEGRSYFVMELVRGIPITEYCDQHHLAPRQRLELFVGVCQAVQHAHQKGIIHRDLKPNNVLVTLGDGDKPIAKVIDFGIAKATGDQRLTDRTLFTEFRQLIGTPLYMSPEQAEMSQLADVDTRSDVYSLGVLLYELLTGTTPFDKQRLAKAAYDEVRRIIREEEPPRPSTRLSTLGETRTSISAQRQSDPKKLSQTVRGELDWIVMKALEKDRARRYETANGLARDVERYLADEPVEACPPSRVYRFKKFARRNKAAIATGVAFAAVLITAAGVSTWQAIRATRAGAVAVQQTIIARGEADKQQAINAFLNEMLQSANPWAASTTQPYKGKDVTVRQALDAAVKRLDAGALEDRPDIEAALRHTIGETYSSLSLKSLGLTQQREALRLARQTHGPEHPEVAQDMVNLGWNLLFNGSRSEAEPLLRDGLAMQRKVLGEKSPELVESTHRLCKLLLVKNTAASNAEAEQLARQILSIDPHATQSLADALAQQGRFVEAEPLYRQALSYAEQQKGDDHPEVAEVLHGLGEVLYQEHRFTEAETADRRVLAIWRKRLDERASLVTDRELDLARVLRSEGKLDDADEHYRQCVTNLLARGEGAGYWVLRICDMFESHEKTAEAESIVREALLACDDAIKMNPDDSGYRAERGDWNVRKGDFAKAVEDYSQALRLRPEPQIYCLKRAHAYFLLGDETKAAADLSHISADAEAQNNLAWQLATDPFPSLRRPRIAVALAEKALATAPGDGNIWNTLGVARYRAGDYGKAIDALNKSGELQKGNHFAWDAFFLAMSNWQLGHKDEAHGWYVQARSWMEKNAPEDEELLRFRAETSAVLQVALPATGPTTIATPILQP